MTRLFKIVMPRVVALLFYPATTDHIGREPSSGADHDRALGISSTVADSHAWPANLLVPEPALYQLTRFQQPFLAGPVSASVSAGVGSSTERRFRRSQAAGQ